VCSSIVCCLYATHLMYASHNTFCRLGLSLVRLPDTFQLPISTTIKSNIPQFVASSSSVHVVQSVVMMASLIGAVSLTQKLCDDNKVGFVRYLAHATVQSIGAAAILYLMLSPELSISSYR
jgi:hypothetical protein